MKLIMDVIGYEKDESTKCVIPEGVVEIGEKVFCECKDITSLIIPKSVKKIGDRAFENCINLESVVINSEDIKIGVYAFLNCSSLKSIVSQNGKIETGYGAFARCASLEEVVFPEIVTMNSFSFSDCTSLSSIKLPKNLKEIPMGTFGACENLRTVTIPDGVERIERDAFSDCKGLESVIIPDSIQFIGLDAFYHCDNTKSVSISPSKISLLDEKMGAVATSSIVKNYYNKTVNYTLEEIQCLKKYIIENRIELFPYALKNIELYKFMFDEIKEIYSATDTKVLLEKVETEEYSNIKVEATAFILEYMRKNNLIGKIDQTDDTLGDLDNDLGNGKTLKK